MLDLYSGSSSNSGVLANGSSALRVFQNWQDSELGGDIELQPLKPLKRHYDAVLMAYVNEYKQNHHQNHHQKQYQYQWYQNQRQQFNTTSTSTSTQEGAQVALEMIDMLRQWGYHTLRPDHNRIM